jgi:hypothetical protein
MQTYSRDPEDVLLDCIEITVRTYDAYPPHCEVAQVLKQLIDRFGEIETWRVTR